MLHGRILKALRNSGEEKQIELCLTLVSLILFDRETSL